MSTQETRRSAEANVLAKFEANPRVGKIRVIVAYDACPSCRQLEGDYMKGEAPALPNESCSHASGCRCYYEPALIDLFP